MVRLENIRINGNIAECDLYPEDSKIPGTLKVNIKTEETEYSLPDGYEYCKSHAAHAKWWLIKNTTDPKKELPEKTTIMWY